MNNVHFSARAPCPGMRTKSEQGLRVSLLTRNKVLKKNNAFSVVWSFLGREGGRGAGEGGWSEMTSIRAICFDHFGLK